jgi:hypothetical protein
MYGEATISQAGSIARLTSLQGIGSISFTVHTVRSEN